MTNGALVGLIAWILVIIGGINWLLIGIVDLNIVSMIFGASFITRLIYIIIGIAACYLIYKKIQENKVL